MVNARRKGHDFERFVSKFLKKFFPASKRHLEYQQAEGHTGVDIENTEPFNIQCKCYQTIAVYKWLEEIKDSSSIPLLIAKAKHKKPIIIGYLDDLAPLIFDPQLISLHQRNGSSKLLLTDLGEDEQD